MGQRHVTSEQLHVARQLAKDFRMSIKDSIDLVWASDTDNVRESFQGNVIMSELKRYSVRIDCEILAESAGEAETRAKLLIDCSSYCTQLFDVDVVAEEIEPAKE